MFPPNRRGTDVICEQGKRTSVILTHRNLIDCFTNTIAMIDSFCRVPASA
jgi:hypothetical protein